MGLFSSNKSKEITPGVPVAPTTPINNTATAVPPVMEPTTAAPTPSILNTNSNKSSMNNITTISQGSTIEGQIKSEGDIIIDGHIKGTVHCKSKIILNNSGKVEGDIFCNEAEISGTIIGKLNITDILILKGSAKIDGDIATGKLVMENGVQFNGKCSMGNVKTAAPQGNNVPKPSIPPTATVNG